jgi:hypothetical protein
LPLSELTKAPHPSVGTRGAGSSLTNFAIRERSVLAENTKGPILPRTPPSRAGHDGLSSPLSVEGLPPPSRLPGEANDTGVSFPRPRSCRPLRNRRKGTYPQPMVGPVAVPPPSGRRPSCNPGRSSLAWPALRGGAGYRPQRRRRRLLDGSHMASFLGCAEATPGQARAQTSGWMAR